MSSNDEERGDAGQLDPAVSWGYVGPDDAFENGSRILGEEEWKEPTSLLAQASKRVRVHFRREVSVKLWLQEVLDVKLENSFVTDLTNGAMLCKLMETLREHSIPRIHTDTQEFFKAKSNILFFLEAARDYGVRKEFLFKVCDLYNLENVVKVMMCLTTLGKLATTKWAGPRIDTRISRCTLEEHAWVPPSRVAAIEKACQEMEERRLSAAQSKVKLVARPFMVLDAETIARITPPITRLQAGVRGRIARNKYRKLLRQAAFRQHAAAEILQTEQSYAKQMILLNNLFISPLIERDVEDPYEISLEAMRDEVQNIVTCSRKLIDLLSPRISDWHPRQCIGDVFLQVTEDMKTYANFLKLYSPFMQEYTEAKTDEWFAMTMKELEKNPLASYQPFESFMIQPIQRIPRYPLMLKELLSRTPLDHPDHENVSLASDKMIAVATYVNERKREFENMSQVMEIQQQWTGEFENLAIPQRSVVRHATVYSILQGQQRNIYLFNDVFVVAAPVYVKRQCKFKVQQVLRLTNFEVVEDLEETAKRCGDPKAQTEATAVVFHIRVRGSGVEQREYCFLLPLAREAANWKRDTRRMQRAEDKKIEDQVKKALEESHGKWEKRTAPSDLLRVLQEEAAHGKANGHERKTISVGQSDIPLCHTPSAEPKAQMDESDRPEAVVTPSTSKKKKRLTVNGLANLIGVSSPTTSRDEQKARRKSSCNKESGWLTARRKKAPVKEAPALSSVTTATKSAPVGGGDVLNTRGRITPRQMLTHGSEEPRTLRKELSGKRSPVPEPRKRMEIGDTYTHASRPSDLSARLSNASEPVVEVSNPRFVSGTSTAAISRSQSQGGPSRRRPKSMVVPQGKSIQARPKRPVPAKPLPPTPVKRAEKSCAKDDSRFAENVKEINENKGGLAPAQFTRHRSRSLGAGTTPLVAKR